jgi:hypothetical protein
MPGRRSGVIRRNALLKVSHEANDYLVALAGESQWIRPVRAASGHVVIGRRRRRPARLVQLRRPSDRRFWAPTSCGRAVGSRAPRWSSAKRGCFWGVPGTRHWRVWPRLPSSIPCSGLSQTTDLARSLASTAPRDQPETRPARA